MAKAFSVTPNRRVDPILKDALKQHARHAGEIIWCWNLLTDQLFWLLTALVTERAEARGQEVAYAIWDLIQSDALKRDLIRGIASRVLKGEPKTLDAIKWLLDRTSDLSPFRNDVAHVPLRFASVGGIAGRRPKVVLSPVSGSGRKQAIERLLKEPTAKNWRRVRGDLLALSNYAFLLALNIRGGPPEPPWPRKPRLLAVQRKKNGAKQKARHQLRKGPPPPP
jgi:hypothetical protein